MRRSSWQVRFMTAVQTHVIHRGSMSTIAVVGFGPGISSAVAEKFGPEGFSVGLVARNQDCLASGVAALNTKEDMKLGALAEQEFWQTYLCCDSCASLWLIFPTLATGFFRPEQRSTASVERSLPQTQHSPALLPARAAARSVMEEVRCLGRRGTRHIVFHRAYK